MKKRLKSIGFALAGIATMVKEEPNAKIHVAAVIVVTSLGIYFQITVIEWLFVTLAIGLVLIAEALNSAVERIMDFVSTEQHPKIKKIKDIAAAAVLFAAMTAIVIGGLIFIPKIF